jgi:hypothetical protein
MVKDIGEPVKNIKALCERLEACRNQVLNNSGAILRQFGQLVLMLEADADSWARFRHFATGHSAWSLMQKAEPFCRQSWPLSFVLET